MSALVYNQLAGRLKETDDFASHANTAARVLVESLDDPADTQMIERNLFVKLPTNEAQAEGMSKGSVSVKGDGNRVAGRDMTVGRTTHPKD